MKMIKIDKDVFIRDEYGVRVRVFVAGTEVEESKYNSVVTPSTDKPKTSALMENKMLSESEAEKVKSEEKTEIVGPPVEEVQAQEEPVKEKKTAKVKAKK